MPKALSQENRIVESIHEIRKDVMVINERLRGLHEV
jgi:hypothetical protein